MQQRIQKFSRMLKLRENDRRTEQTILASERREEEEALQRLDLLGQEKNQAMASFSGNKDKIFSRSEIWFQRQAIEVLEKHIGEGKENLRDIQHRITLTEERLVERHRDVRMMEGYVDRLKENLRQTEITTEQIELDDIAVMRYTRPGVQKSGSAVLLRHEKEIRKEETRKEENR
ncbi:MAG: flagellar FliJ family protein [Synergistaceae bacterium]|jgi:flagellar export protein FliJ|nr:flagellar FliJ family protein [Synergistaceae bacterium]